MNFHPRTLSWSFYYGNECKLQLNAMQWFENAILACFCYVCASSSVFRSDWEAKTWRDQGCTSSSSSPAAETKTWLRPNSQSEISELSASEWCITWSPLFWLVIMPSQRENKGLKLQTFKDEDLHTIMAHPIPLLLSTAEEYRSALKQQCQLHIVVFL